MIKFKVKVVNTFMAELSDACENKFKIPLTQNGGITNTTFMMRKVMQDILLVFGNTTTTPISWLGCKIVNLLKTLLSVVASSTNTSNGYIILGWAIWFYSPGTKQLQLLILVFIGF
jgi:hypothetical protein